MSTMRVSWFVAASVSFAVLVLKAAADQPRDAKSAKFEPVIFGTAQGNVGCVILKRARAVKKNWLATGTVVPAGEYEVVETFHYEMAQTTFQGQKGADELNRIGQKERMKFVVIPARYTMDQLDVARDECQKNLVVQAPPPEGGKEGLTTVRSETSPAQGITPPEVVYEPLPAYTPEARKAGIEGSVALSITVDERGKVSDVDVMEGLGYGLDEQAAKTVKTWKFNPALKDGKPVAVRVIVVASFKLYRQTP